MKRFSLYLLIMVLLGTPVAARCQDQGQPSPDGAGAQVDQQGQGAVQEEAGQEGQATGEEAAELPAVHYVMEPDIETWLGGRFVHLDGSTRAMEYGWPHSSLAGGLRLHYDPLPHRLDADLDWLNSHDYRGDFSYAYKDVLKFNYTGLGLWHNLDHFKPLPMPPSVDLSPNDLYHVAISDNRISLRLKWPERAYHVFSDFRQFEKEGTVQERFYNDPLTGAVKTMRSRDIDWITRRYIMGANGHLGPIELEYYHMIKTFEPHKQVSTLMTAGVNTVVRSFVPTFETNSDTIKAHTDLTGSVVASATFITGEKTNHHSGSEIDFNRGFGDLTLIPFDHLTVAVRYRYKTIQEKVPPTFGVSAVALLPGITTDPIDSHTHIAGVTVRYNPINAFAVKADYEFQKVERTNANLWSDPDVFPFQSIPFDQNIHTVKLGVNTRPLKTLNFKGSLEYAYTEEPAYPTKPMNSYKGKFDADWTPGHNLNLDAYYRFLAGENNTAHMDLRTDNIGALLSWIPTDRLSVYANYDYSRLKNERDIRFISSTAGDTFPIDHVPYRDSSHVYSIGAGYGFAFPLTVRAEFYQSWSRGMFRTGVSDTVVTTAAIGPLTDMRIRETGANFNARYDLPKGWGASFDYRVNNFEDLKDLPQDGPQDGTAHTVLVMLSRKW